jgi:predicted alpha/beta superfamily hydrolase
MDRSALIGAASSDGTRSADALLCLKTTFMFLIVGALLDAPGVAIAASAPRCSISPCEVSLPNTRHIEFISSVNHHRYVINIALPLEGTSPPGGYGVFYVLDGYWGFSAASAFVRSPANPANVVVVGIGYPDNGPVSKKRVYDLTLPATDAELKAQTFSGDPWRSVNVGGVNDFLMMIEKDVKPRVAALVHVDPANQALFGHSFGGLAALHALFVEPNAFRTFILSSPSVWWNNIEVLADEQKFAKEVSQGRAAPRVLVTVGSEEASIPEIIPPRWHEDRATVEAETKYCKMFENARDLAAQLKDIHGGPGYVVGDFTVFDKIDHAAAPWPALARGIVFAFSDTPAGS